MTTTEKDEKDGTDKSGKPLTHNDERTRRNREEDDYDETTNPDDTEMCSPNPTPKKVIKTEPTDDHRDIISDEMAAYNNRGTEEDDITKREIEHNLATNKAAQSSIKTIYINGGGVDPPTVAHGASIFSTTHNESSTNNEEEEVKASNAKVAKWMDNNNDTLEKIRLETCGEFEKEYYGLVNQSYNHNSSSANTGNSASLQAQASPTIATRLAPTSMSVPHQSQQIPSISNHNDNQQQQQQQQPYHLMPRAVGGHPSAAVVVPPSSHQAQPPSDRYPVRFIQLRPPQPPPHHVLYHPPSFGGVGYGAQIHHPAVGISGGLTSPLQSPNEGMC